MFMLQNLIAYIQAQPVQVLAALLFLVVLPIALFGLLIWGMAQIWLFWKQGQYAASLKWDLLEVSVPQDAVNTPKGMENFFNNIAGSKSAITWKEKWLDGKFQAYFSFEFYSDGGFVHMYMRTLKKYRDIVEASLYAQYPEASITEVEDYAKDLPREFPNDDWDLFGSEMVLSNPDFLPVRTYEMFEHMGEKDFRFKDPILPLIESLGKIRPGEKYMLQFIIMPPDEQAWIKEGKKYIEEKYGKVQPAKKGMIESAIGWIPGEVMNQVAGIEPQQEKSAADDWAMFKITPQERLQLDAVTEKISKLGWMTKIRWVYIAKHELYRKGTMASMTKGIFHQYGHLGWNKIGLHGPSTPKDDYFYQEWAMPMKQRRLMGYYIDRNLGSGATPNMYNSAELATMFHFPAADARTPVLTQMGARRAEAPVDLTFAAPEAQILPNIDRGKRDTTAAPAIPAKPAPLKTPTLSSPTGPVRGADTAFDRVPHALPVQETVHGMPQAGVPAPLPPGLDISDTPIENTDVPNNLPM